MAAKKTTPKATAKAKAEKPTAEEVQGTETEPSVPATEPTADSTQDADSAGSTQAENVPAQSDADADEQSPAAGDDEKPAVASSPETQAAPSEPPKPRVVMRIISKVPGFRRAGFHFNDRQETVLYIDDLTDEQIDALRSEPLLICKSGVQED